MGTGVSQRCEKINSGMFVAFRETRAELLILRKWTRFGMLVASLYHPPCSRFESISNESRVEI